MPEVVLVQLPFAPDLSPSMGLSALKGALIAGGVSVEIHYSNLAFQRTVSSDLYDTMLRAETARLLPEMVFAPFAFPEETERHERAFERFRRSQDESGSELLDRLIRLQHAVPAFLEETTTAVLAGHPRIVGFHTGCLQVCAAVAASRAIKCSLPDVLTVIGGYHALEPMASALLEIAPSIDYAFSGEADFEFVQFCKKALEGFLPGQRVIVCEPVEDLDALPFPDFSDFYAQTAGTPHVRLVLETSRGCWWAQKKRCLFCGGLGPGGRYRSKSTARVKKELSHLASSCIFDSIYPTDNIFPKHASESFLLDADPVETRHARVLCEMKPVVTLETLLRLKRGGLHYVRPGIETLSDRLLSILGKGTTAAGSVRFLRDCRSAGLDVAWNLLYGIPGEAEADYEEMMDLIPRIAHLSPPLISTPVVIQRFSPLFENWRQYGIARMEPMDAYGDVFPASADCRRLAAYFAGEFPRAFDRIELKRRFFRQIGKWRMFSACFDLTLDLMRLEDGSYSVRDTRRRFDGSVCGGPEITRVSENHVRLLEKLRRPVPTADADRFAAGKGLSREYRALIENHWVVELGGRMVSLPVERHRTPGSSSQGPSVRLQTGSP